MGKLFIAIGVSLALLAATSIQGLAQDVIYGCVDEKGKLRIVSDTSECKRKETPISWNVVGPQGEPGPQGPTGPQGEQGLPGECDCPITQEQLDELYDRIGYLMTSRFTEMGDGTIRDNDTGLIWLKNANCFGAQFWIDAMDAAHSPADGQCGLADGSAATEWRLPTKEELGSVL